MIDHEDVAPDDMFYICRSPGDLKWRLFDGEEESHCTDTLPEMRNFVFGLWRGMAIVNGDVDLTCAIYSDTGVLLDTMSSKEMLGG